MRLRGKPEAILDFLRNEIICVARKPGNLDLVVEQQPDINECCSEITLKMPTEMNGLIWKSFYIKDTKRNFFDGEHLIYVYVDTLKTVTTVHIAGFRAAWAIKHEPYLSAAWNSRRWWRL